MQKEITEGLEQIARKIWPQASDVFARQTVRGDKWEIGYTNDYPMQHGDGERFSIPNVVAKMLLEGTVNCSTPPQNATPPHPIRRHPRTINQQPTLRDMKTETKAQEHSPTIEEMNRVIAIFDGFVVEDSFPDKGRTYSRGKRVELDTTFTYHSDWNELHRIVDKLFEVTCEHDQVFAGLVLFELAIVASVNEVHTACFEAIQRYNKRKEEEK